jgi:hypothetical protein
MRRSGKMPSASHTVGWKTISRNSSGNCRSDRRCLRGRTGGRMIGIEPVPRIFERLIVA